QELRASSEEIRQRGATFVRFEPVVLLDADPWQLLTSPRQLVAAPRQLSFCLEQAKPRRQPLFACSDHVFRHCSLRSLCFAEWPEPTAYTVTTAPAHSITAVRNVGESIVQSTITVASRYDYCSVVV